MPSLSETISPKALDEKRPIGGRRRFLYPEVGEQSHARSRAASRKAAAGLPQSKGLWPDSPLHSSLRTQYLCVSFDINNDAVRVSSLPKNLQ
jgi:hypothetical protein